MRTRGEWARARGRNGDARGGAREENHQTREALDAEWTRADGESLRVHAEDGKTD